MKTFCTNEKCFKDFEIDLLSKETKAGYIQSFFICPYCKTKYKCYKESQYTLGLQQQMQQIVSSLTTVKDEVKHTKLFKRYKELKELRAVVFKKINKKNFK